jgi:unsaturated rhamnogalacturonyl hydrolase
MMDRRRFMGAGLVAGSALYFWPVNAFGEMAVQNGSSCFHLPATLIRSPKAQMPAGKRIPFGWETFTLPAAGKPGRVTLQFAKPEMSFTEMRLRICPVTDIREEIRIDVVSLASRLLIGSFDIRYPHVLQPFEILIDPSHHADVLRKGVSLQMVKGSVPAWFLSAKGPESEKYNALRAHLLLYNSPGSREHYHTMLGSLNSVQQFGWMEGCVLDGLYDLFRSSGRHQFLSTLSAHLELFFNKEKKLDYEDPRSNFLKDKFYGIESTLPVAIIAKLEPRHPIVNLFVEFCRDNTSDDGLIADDLITTEGCYTLAYPLAEVAVAKSDPELAALAINQLLLRHRYLSREGDIHQRATRSGATGYANWGRGVAWYLLGMVKTLVSLAKNEAFTKLEGVEEIRAIYEESVKWALRHQQSNGLWFSYLKEGVTGTDTSGSAGIAAAMALGEKHGWLTFSVRENTERSFNQLLKMLTPDGYLTGANQSNKGGEELQRGGYRVISPYALGLMAQLEAAL